MFKYCHVRKEIDNSELRVIGDFTTISTLESLGILLRDPNIANHCKISYNPSLVVVYFYIVSQQKIPRCYITQRIPRFVFQDWTNSGEKYKDCESFSVSYVKVKEK